MRKIPAMLLLVICLACSKYSVMTQDRFAEISTGTPIKMVVERYGSPLEIRSIGKNQDLYQYSERITLGAQTIQQRKYFLIVTDGKVVGKYTRFENPPPYQAIYSDDIFPDQ